MRAFRAKLQENWRAVVKSGGLSELSLVGKNSDQINKALALYAGPHLTSLKIQAPLIIHEIDWTPLKRCTHLRTLELSVFRSLLKEIPPFLQELPTLQELSLSDNDLARAADWNYLPKGLRVLDISACNLTSIPEALSSLPELRVLKMFVNDLSNVTQWNFPTRLTTLHLGNTGLRRLPNLSSLEELKHLNLEYNNLSGTESDASWDTLPASLVELNIAKCSLKKLPSRLTTLPELRVLKLDENDLHEVQDWNLPPSLTTLSLYDCHLTKTPSLSHLTDLTSLNLMRNKLTIDDADKNRLPQSLENLDLSNTSIKQFSPLLSNLINLKALNIGNNFFKNLPKKRWAELNTLPSLKKVNVSNSGVQARPPLREDIEVIMK